jgi:four helix bundle protein
MSSIRSYKDLRVWQESHSLSADIYKTFMPTKDYSFKDQIQRASVSIMNNIAEGYARRSDKAFKNFLFIALGSAAETESMLYLAATIGYIQVNERDTLLLQTEKIQKLLNAFIRKIAASQPLLADS